MYTYVCIPYRSEELRTQKTEVGSHLFYLISSQKQYQSGEESKKDVKKNVISVKIIEKLSKWAATLPLQIHFFFFCKVWQKMEGPAPRVQRNQGPFPTKT